MQYMLLVYFKEQVLADDGRQECYQESIELTRELNAKGQFLAAAPLHPVSTATSVQMRDGRRVVTDGPFAETREQLGGYYLIDVKDLDEAIDVASRIPGARWGTVEIRPVVGLTGMPAANSRMEQQQ